MLATLLRSLKKFKLSLPRHTRQNVESTVVKKDKHINLNWDANFWEETVTKETSGDDLTQKKFPSATEKESSIKQPPVRPLWRGEKWENTLNLMGINSQKCSDSNTTHTCMQKGQHTPDPISIHLFVCNMFEIWQKSEHRMNDIKCQF